MQCKQCNEVRFTENKVRPVKLYLFPFSIATITNSFLAHPWTSWAGQDASTMLTLLEKKLKCRSKKGDMKKW